MIYSIQSYLENYFNRCGFTDADQYAIALATVYDRQRHGKTVPGFLSAMKRIQTSFYKRNQRARRPDLERKILSLLDTKFKKKESFSYQKGSRKELRLQAIG